MEYARSLTSYKSVIKIIMWFLKSLASLLIFKIGLTSNLISFPNTILNNEKPVDSETRVERPLLPMEDAVPKYPDHPFRGPCPKESSNRYVDFLYFSVGLRPVGCRSLLLDVERIAHALKERGLELSPLIGVNPIWPAVPLFPLSDWSLENCLCCHFWHRQSLRSTGENVNYRQNVLICPSSCERALAAHNVDEDHLKKPHH